MNKRKPLTYDDIADIHDKNERSKARAKPLDRIIKWARSRPDLIVYDSVKDLFYAVAK